MHNIYIHICIIYDMYGGISQPKNTKTSWSSSFNSSTTHIYVTVSLLKPTSWKSQIDLQMESY